MSSEPLRIATKRLPDRVIVELEGELDLVSAPLLDDTLAGLALDGAATVVLDLRAVSFVDSTGLKAIFRARNAAGEHGRQFAVTRGSPQVERLLELTRLNEHLQLIDTPDAVLA